MKITNTILSKLADTKAKTGLHNAGLLQGTTTDKLLNVNRYNSVEQVLPPRSVIDGFDIIDAVRKVFKKFGKPDSVVTIEKNDGVKKSVINLFPKQGSAKSGERLNLVSDDFAMSIGKNGELSKLDREKLEKGGKQSLSDFTSELGKLYKNLIDVLSIKPENLVIKSKKL
jgi:hypothetical protein